MFDIFPKPLTDAVFGVTSGKAFRAIRDWQLDNESNEKYLCAFVATVFLLVKWSNLSYAG